MKKKGILLFIFLLLTSSLLSLAVFAEDEKSGAMSQMGALLKSFISGEYGMHFLLWIMLFALINFGLKQVKFDQKVSGIIAFALSLGAVFAIPANFLNGIFAVYGIIVMWAFGVIVPLILVMVINKSFDGDDMASHLIRAVGFIIMGAALFQFRKWSTSGVISPKIAPEMAASLSSAAGWVGLVAGLLWIIGIFNILSAFGDIGGSFGKISGALGKTGGELRNIPGKADQGWKDARKAVLGVRGSMDWSGAGDHYLDKLEDHIEGSADEATVKNGSGKITRQIDRFVFNLHRKLKHNYDDADKLAKEDKNMSSEIRSVVSQIRAAENSIIRFFSRGSLPGTAKEFDNLLKEDVAAHGGFDKWKEDLLEKVSEAISWNNSILANLARLKNIDEDFLKKYK